MDEFRIDNKYESFKIPRQLKFSEDMAVKGIQEAKAANPVSLDSGSFYEIEYDSCPIPGVGKFVLKSQKIEEPEKDERRELFHRMKDIARAYRFTDDNNSRFFDRRIQQDNAIIFYKQGMFMKDFTDNYTESIPFSQYFPYYQMMGYEQLRTYFTWRTQVREGNIADISLSYAFLYIYELLSNIGVSDPQDGLNQLMSFWRSFRTYNKSIDKYALRWLKDYHIYYELPQSFKDFVEQNDLTGHYPKMTDLDDIFHLFCTISKYDISKSTFFTGENEKLVTDCFCFVIKKLRQISKDIGVLFDSSIFQPTKKMSEWKPFKDALFYQWVKQSDRRIVLSENEIYICSNNKWTFNTVITSESGRQLVGYIMKQMEAALRKVTGYKYNLSANSSTITHEIVDQFKKANVSLEKAINNAVTEFYRETTKTVVIVDQNALSRIREEALLTQEKLIVPEQDNSLLPKLDKLILPEQNNSLLPKLDKLILPEQDNSLLSKLDKSHLRNSEKALNTEIPDQIELNLSYPDIWDMPSIPETAFQAAPECDIWQSLKDALTDVELGALTIVMHGNTELKKYADDCGVMLEVLIDGINEKAMDFIGDNLLDEEFVLFDDYKKQVKELIK